MDRLVWRRIRSQEASIESPIALKNTVQNGSLHEPSNLICQGIENFCSRNEIAFGPDAEFLRSGRAVLYRHGHFRTSGTWKAVVLKPINSGPLVSAQRLGTFQISLHQLADHLI
jgi:hypothetical protein